MFRRYLHFLNPERRGEVLNQLSQASSPNFDFYLMVILSTSIATLGLIVDSPAVVIGAMLVAPLMSPILGLSLASVAGEQRMFRRAFGALILGIVLSIALSAGLSLLVRALPFDALTIIPEEILSRTHPTPFDLGIALAGGAAAAYALAQPNLSAALPGVAIATALVPPLCTVGIGISLRSPEIAFGALLLFATNLVAISFAGIVVFAALGFRPYSYESNNVHLRNNLIISAILVLLVTIPLVVLSLRFVSLARQEQAENAYKDLVRSNVSTEISKIPNAQLVDTQITQTEGVLHLLVTVRSARNITYQEVLDLQAALATRLERPLALELIDVPMIRLDPKVPPTLTPTPTPGPSLTPTPTATRTKTPVPPTSSPTNTLTPTTTPTSTQTPTSTPVAAFIDTPKGAGVYLRADPNGKIIGILPDGAPVQILYRRETLNEIQWIEIQDLLGRKGWVQSSNLVIRP